MLHTVLVQFQDIEEESQNWASCLQCKDLGLSLSDVKLLPNALTAQLACFLHLPPRERE